MHLLLTLLLAQDAEPAAVAALRARLDRAAVSPLAWRARRREVRERILVAAGLWPEFDRPPVRAVVAGKTDRDGYSVEKVRIETRPGFWLPGNLYRPLGKKGPFPGIVSPHGHWKVGRFNDDDRGSIPGRCITLARLGFVVLSYDMVGYGDFTQVPHAFEDHEWGLDLLGLQLWNSLRAVDFLESLPDVDPKRLGATGASGGGTQTFLLAAVDDRIACAAPVNMVSAEFQGGCSCENAPFLRIGVNNVEIAAMTAPRPLLLVACTGDWTKHTPALEGPIVRKVYEAHGVPERFRAVQFDYPHNYNRESREAVYAWMTRWLAGGKDVGKIAEPAFEAGTREELTLYPDGKPPEGAVDAEGLARLLRSAVTAQLESLRPEDTEGFVRFERALRPAFRHAFQAEWPDADRIAAERAGPAAPAADFVRLKLKLGDRAGSIELRAPNHDRGRRTTVLVVEDYDERDALVQGLLERGHRVYVLDLDDHAPEPASGGNDRQRRTYPTTFFRTGLARRVQDVLTAVAFTRRSVGLVGVGGAGLPVLLARTLTPNDAARVTVVDLAGLDDSDPELWKGARSHPYMRRFGGLRSAAMLVAGSGAVFHHFGPRFDMKAVRTAAGVSTVSSPLFGLSPDRLTPAQIAHIVDQP